MTGFSRLTGCAMTCIAAITSAVSPAFGWKVDAHVWIAAEVLKDVRDGSITIMLGDRPISVRLPPARAAALRANPRAYLVGSLGPDAFPDVLAGQLVIHASDDRPEAWGTGDWLQHLFNTPDLNSEELAFVMGYLSHAAADTFAHTFVNRYSGDLFQAFQHPTAATRHIYIEGFVSRHLPPISVAGLEGSDAASLLRVDGRVAVPIRPVLERFLLDPRAVDQFKEGAPHLALAYGLYRDLDKLLEPDGALEQLQVDIKDFIAELYLEVPIDDRLIGDLNRLQNGMDDWINGQIADLRPLLLEVNDSLAEIEGAPLDLAESSLKAAVDIQAEILRVGDEINAAAQKVLDVEREMQRLVDQGLDTEEARGSCNLWVAVLLGPHYCAAYQTVRVATALWKEKTALKYQALALEQNLRNELLARKDDLKGTIGKAIDLIRESNEANRAARAWLITMATDRPFGDQLRNMFLRWRDGIPVALAAYSRANADTIANSVDKRIMLGEDPDAPGLMDPMRDWLICYGPVFLGVPATVAEQGCATAIGTILNVRTKLDEFESELAKVLSPLDKVIELKKKIQVEIERLQNRLLDEAILAGLGEFDAIAKTNTAEFYEALATETTSSKLDAALSSDASGQNLPTFDNASGRIIAEMKLNAQGQIDPEAFPAIYNSIVLSKLSLLDASGLNEIARQAGVTSSTYYSDGLYGDRSEQARNVLFGFLRSIDGNHQWQHLAPPHPRAVPPGYDEDDFRQRRDEPALYGYGLRDLDCRRVFGMRFWVDPQAREAVFKKIFKGGLTLGVDEPEALGFGPALPADYPDLYNNNEGWWIDAIDWEEGEAAPVNVRFVGMLPLNSSATLSGPGMEPQQINPTADGSFDLPLSVQRHLLPARFDLIERSGRRTMRYGFDIGCNGEVVTELPIEPVVVVEPGDNLWRITVRLVGDGSRYPEIAEANADVIRNPDLIYPGQRFRAPWKMPVAVTIEPEDQDLATLR